MFSILLEDDYKPNEARRLLNALNEYRRARKLNPKYRPPKIALRYNIDTSLFGSAVSSGAVHNLEDAMIFLYWWDGPRDKVDFRTYLDWVEGVYD